MTQPAHARLSALAKLRLGVEVLFSYARARRAVRDRPLPEALSRLRGWTGAPPAVAGSPDRLARATQRTLSLLPSDTRCLMQALTLSALLARRGIKGTLVIGVSPGQAFGAHAWVELDGRPLLDPGGESFGRLVEL